MTFTIHGLPVSSGIAIGHVHLVSHALLEVNHYHVAPKYLQTEIQRLKDAIADVQQELQDLRQAASEGKASNEISAFVDLQLMMLADPLLADAALRLVETRYCNAEWALVQQMEILVDQFEQIEDPYLRERKADVVQVVERIVKRLLGHPGHLPPKRRSSLGTIIVAHDLSPSDTIGFREHCVDGFVTDVGGPTSHTAIVARSLSIPAVVGLHHIRHLVEEGDVLIIDGSRGVVIVAPDENIVQEYRLRRTELEVERHKLSRLKDTSAVTLDGEEVELLANIEGPKDIAQIRAVKADGVGLYRSEFLFIGRASLPDEEEQYQAYRQIVKAMQGKAVTIRTFDAGADKVFKGFDAGVEMNPALGLRAVRYTLADPKLFLIQLRALLRASAHGKLRIMIPMITHAQEIDQTLSLLEKAKGELKEEGHKFDNAVDVGGMIEVPAAALALGMFVRRLAFLSIGTNDLIQYTLAIDRSNESVVHLYDPLHPAILKLIGSIIQTGARYGVPVSVCGEIAGDPAFTRLLLGMGLRHFSMHPSKILEVKQHVVRANIEELAPRVQKILKMDEPVKVRDAVKRLSADKTVLS